MRRQIDPEVRRIVHAEFAAEKFLERCPVFQHQNTNRIIKVSLEKIPIQQRHKTVRKSGDGGDSLWVSLVMEFKVFGPLVRGKLFQVALRHCHGRQQEQWPAQNSS